MSKKIKQYHKDKNKKTGLLYIVNFFTTSITVCILIVVLFFISNYAGKLYFQKIKMTSALFVQASTVSVSLTENQKIINTDFRIPIHIKIPSIDVDATIESVGITKTGILDVPKISTDVGWYQYGTRPGEKGSAVIDGHSGTMNGIPAVFDSLYKLKIGDIIYIENGNGDTIGFVVRAFQSYDKNDNTAEVFDSVDGQSHLNLITCEPAWNEIQKSYFKRLVVFTDKINNAFPVQATSQ